MPWTRDPRRLDQETVVLSDACRRSAKVIELFLNASARDMHLLEAAFAQQRWLEAAELAHKLMGGCRAIGAAQMASLCQRVEKAAREGAADEEGFALVRDAHAATCAALREERARGRDPLA